ELLLCRGARRARALKGRAPRSEMEPGRIASAGKAKDTPSPPPPHGIPHEGFAASTRGPLVRIKEKRRVSEISGNAPQGGASGALRDAPTHRLLQEPECLVQLLARHVERRTDAQ